jgi:hypothetical protein
VPTTASPVPANNNNCGGYYSLDNPFHQNFGDPNCEFANNPAAAKDSLLSLLKQLDTADHAATWFAMIPLESSYNPNAWASPSTGTPDQGGAWGLLQMGQGSQNKPYDNGRVYWQEQVKNAVLHLQTFETPNKWNSCGYWASARALVSPLILRQYPTHIGYWGDAENLKNVGSCFTIP